MCRSADCSTCQLKSWTGCGQHVAAAMSQFPKSEWCTCINPDGSRGEFPPKAGQDNSTMVFGVMLVILAGIYMIFKKK